MIELMQTIEVNSVDPHDTKHLDSSNFQKTEIGQIPKDWELVDLGAVSIISRLAGAEYTSVWRESPSGEIIALRGFNIEKNKINLRDIVRISDKLSRKLKRSRLTKGDVVYPCVGTIGNAAVIYEDDTYHIQQNIARITPDTSRVKSEFLSHYLTSSFAEKEVEKFNATSSQPNVLVSSLRQYKVPLPKTLNEQIAIANALSDVDALIQELEKLIAKKQAIKTATMQQLLTGRTRLPQFAHYPDGRKKGYKPSELGEIPEDWYISNVKQVSLVPMQNGLFYQPLRKGKGVPLINVSDMYKTAPIDVQGLELFDATPAEIKVFKVSDGDLFFTRSSVVPSGIAYCNIFHSERNDVVFDSHLIRVRPNTDLVDPNYLYLNCTSKHARNALIAEAKTATMTTIDQGAINRCPVLIPTKSEQSAIANMLSDMDLEIQALDQHLNKTRQIKQGMMQELLTGKTRLV